jgi:hypothetical protein
MTNAQSKPVVNRRIGKREDPALVARRERRDALDRIAREAAEVVRSKLRTLIDSKPKYPKTNTKIPVHEITYSMISMAEVAASYEHRLSLHQSSVHALQIRLCNWASSGRRDIIVEQGRPSKKKLTPVKKLAISRVIGGNSDGDMSAAQISAVTSNLTGVCSTQMNAREERAQRKSLRASGIVRAVSTPTAPTLLHAAGSSSLNFALYNDLQEAYTAMPHLVKKPIMMVNWDEGNDPDRAGRAGFKCHGFTTVEKLKANGRKQLRTIAIPDGAGTGSSCPWFAASGDIIAKTPIVEAPPGWNPGPSFLPPPSFTEPARHAGLPFLPGMMSDYFTNGNTRVYCTESGVNNKECYTRMFIDFVYPLWRAKAGPGALLLIFDSCKAHNWTEELCSFFAANDVHVLKLYHNTTTRTQPCDCGINLESRKRTVRLQDKLMAAASFQHAFLGQDLEVQFRDPKRVRRQ